MGKKWTGKSMLKKIFPPDSAQWAALYWFKSPLPCLTKSCTKNLINFQGACWSYFLGKGPLSIPENGEALQKWPLSLSAVIDSPWLSMPKGNKKNHCPTATQSSRLSHWPQRTRIQRPWAEPKNPHFNKQEIWPAEGFTLSEEWQPPSSSAPSSPFNLLNIFVWTPKSKSAGFLTRFCLLLFPGVLRIKNCYGYIHKWGTIIDDKLKHK